MHENAPLVLLTQWSKPISLAGSKNRLRQIAQAIWRRLLVANSTRITAIILSNSRHRRDNRMPQRIPPRYSHPRAIKLIVLGLVISIEMLLAHGATADNAPLSEEQALVQFYQQNLGILAARYIVDSARAQEMIAAEFPNPQLSFDLFKITPRAVDGYPGRSARIDQLIELGGKRRLRVAAATLGTQASEHDLKDALRTLSNALRHAYYTQVLAQKSVSLASDEFEHLKEVEKISELRFKRGDIAESDFLRIQVETDQASSDLDTAQAQLTSARAALALLLAWPADAATLRVAETWPQSMQRLAGANADSLIAKALSRRPDLEAARLRSAQAREQVKLAQKLQIPDVTVGVDYQHDADNSAVDSYGFGFQVAIPIFNQYKGEIAQAKANLSTTELQALLQEKTIRSEIERGFSAWQAAARITQRFQAHVLARVTAIRQAAELAYSKGATSVLDLIDAERRYKAMLHDYHAALTNQTLAYYDLVQAQGEDLAL